MMAASNCLSLEPHDDHGAKHESSSQTLVADSDDEGFEGESSLQEPIKNSARDGETLYSWEIWACDNFTAHVEVDFFGINTATTRFVRENKDDPIDVAVPGRTKRSTFAPSIVSVLNGEFSEKRSVYDALVYRLIPSTLAHRMVDEILGFIRDVLMKPSFDPCKILLFYLDVKVYCVNGDYEHDDYRSEEDSDAEVEEDGDGDGDYFMPTSKGATESLERKMHEASSKEDATVCTICLEEIVDGEEIIRMPCSHLFHRGCILQWLEIGHVCPFCRFEMPVD